MTAVGAPPILGGCQCGAVRYALSALPETEFCHCRMCQRATGGVFAALSMVQTAELAWTKGAPAYFRSSTAARRGFCRDCGTPLTFEYDGKDRMEVTTGSLDDPEVAPLREHFGVESRVSWLKLCDGLPEHRTGDGADSPVNDAGFASNQVRAE